MKLQYMDLLTPIGHKKQNTKYIDLLTKTFDVVVTCPVNWYENKTLNAKFVQDKFFFVEDGKYRSRINTIISMMKNYFVIKKEKPDFILISSFDTILLGAFVKLYNRQLNNRIKVLHHMNIDETANSIKRTFFKKYMNNIDHIVFEDFIKDYLIKEFKIDESNIYVLPHQLNCNKNDKYCRTEIKYDCVGLSNSNDETIIDELIKYEMENEFFKKSGKKIVLKSKYKEFDNGALKIIKGYLPDQAYEDYISKCESIFMPFPNNFNYRISGTLIDALSNNKVVIGTDIRLLNQYSKKYPNICKVIQDTVDFVEIINNLNSSAYQNDFMDFKENHKDDVIEKTLKSIFIKEHKTSE